MRPTGRFSADLHFAGFRGAGRGIQFQIVKNRRGSEMSRQVYKAIIYVEEADGKGNVTLRKVTTSKWVTVPQIAASVGVSPQTMYRSIVDEGAMPFYRFGSQIKVRAEDFKFWYDNCRNGEYERPLSAGGRSQ